MKPIVLLGEAYGQNEDRIQAAFVGASGIELLRMLDEAKVIQLSVVDLDYLRRFWSENDPRLVDMVWRLHPEVQRLNVFNLHPHGNDIKNLWAIRRRRFVVILSTQPDGSKLSFQVTLTSLDVILIISIPMLSLPLAILLYGPYVVLAEFLTFVGPLVYLALQLRTSRYWQRFTP